MNTADAPPSVSVEALVSDVTDEFMGRLDRGEQPDVEEYAARHPRIAEVLRQLLPALQALRLPAGDSASPSDALPREHAMGTLGDFRLMREVGRGGMGVVYEAEQISLGRRVALKVLPFASTLDAKQLQRFKNEAQAAAGLHHTNIVPVFATGCERGVHYYAMQFIEGQTLADVIADLRLQSADSGKQVDSREMAPAQTATQNGEPAATDFRPAIRNLKSPMAPTPPVAALSTEKSTTGPGFFRAVATLGMQAAEALDYSHELGVIHRDIKPANMLVDGRGKLWITDFGLAHCQSQAGLTMSGDLVGTLRYMSPEQALAKRVLVDHRTDIYSLGATLYELLTLEPVFPGADRQELLRQIAFEEPKPLRRHNKSIPAELETIVLKALEKNPADRYATAQELADDLERFVKDEPIRASRPSLARRFRKWCGRHKPLVWSATVAALVVTVVLAGTIGWAARDKAVRQAVVETEVHRALKEVQRLQDQARWPQALEVARQTQTLLESGSSDEILREQVGERVNDVRMMLRLEEIRLNTRAFSSGTIREMERADSQYGKAFQDYGLDVDALRPDETAAIILAKSVRLELAMALDTWARVRRGGKNNDKGWKHLNAIARAADPDEWRNRFRHVWESGDEKELKVSLEKLLASAKVDELLPESIVLFGTALRNADGVEQAIDFLRTSQRRHCGHFWINQSLASWLASSSPPRVDEAIRYYWASIAIRPDYPISRVDLGNAFRKKGELDEAMTHYHEALRLKPDYAAAYYNLGNALHDQHKAAEAVMAFRQAIELWPDFAEVYNGLGAVLCDDLKKFPEAEVAFRKAIKLQPDSADAYNNLGNALWHQKKLPEAEAAYRKAIELDPNDANTYINLDVTLAGQNKLPEAEAACRKAIELDPKNSRAYNNLAAALQWQNKLPDAERACRKAIELDPKNAMACYNLGIILERQNKLPEAEAACRKAIELDPKYAMGYDHLGIILGRQNKLPEAEAACRKAIDLKPDLAAAHCNLGYALAYQQKFPEAIAAARKAVDLDPLDAKIQYNAACVAALAGCAQGKDAAEGDAMERARLRVQALAWLRAALTARQKELEKVPGKANPALEQQFRHWQQDKDFNGVRGDEALAKLPEAERQEWRRLWEEVEELERRAAMPAPTSNHSMTKE